VEQAGFARLSHLVVTDPELSDGAVRLYARLLWYARRDVRCWPGRERLAQDLGVSESTIRRRLSDLIDRGLITREQRGMGKTAMTYIEDLATVYGEAEAVDNSSPVKNDAASSVKNDAASAPSNLTHKEEQEEETDMKDVGLPPTQVQTCNALIDFGVTPTVARWLARRCDPEHVRGWLAYTRQAEGLHSPVAFVVAKLRDGEPPPATERESEVERRHRYAEWLQGGDVLKSSRSDYRHDNARERR
jgi:DNA-binding transcriptional ArsR family regulator